MKSAVLNSLKSLGIAGSFAVVAPFANAVDLIDLGDFPAWFTDAMAREVTVANTSDFELTALSAKGKVPGALSLEEQEEGYWYYNINIGTGSPVECYVFTEFDGPANSLNAIIKHNLQGAEALNGKSLSGQFNYAIDSGLTGATPYLQLDTLYMLGEGADKVSGVIKAMSAQTEQSLQICTHNEIGYRATFRSVFDAFVQAFAQPHDAATFFSPVYRVSINGMHVGFSREVFSVDSDGDVGIENYSAYIFPVDASSVATSDNVSTSWSRADGSLINANQYAIENSTLASRYAISYNEDAWYVEGELQGKAISGKLDYNSWLLSGLGSYLETEILKQSEKTSATFHMWAPDADPLSALEVNLSKIDSPNANFKLDMGALVMEFQAKEHGIFEQGTLSRGALKMQMELIYLHGKPVLP